MGSIELLSREGEIAIAKRIEASREAMIAGLCREKGKGSLLMASSSSARGATGSAPLPAKILPPPRNKTTSVVFTT
jgi:Sigma-70 factor, region 1.2